MEDKRRGKMKKLKFVVFVNVMTLCVCVSHTETADGEEHCTCE